MVKKIFAFLFLSVFFGFSLAGDEGFVPTDMKTCQSEKISAPCKAELSKTEIAEILSSHDEKKFDAEIKNNTLTVTAKIPSDAIREYGRPYICCDIQAYLDPIAPDIYGAKFYWSEMSTALINIDVINVSMQGLRAALPGSKKYLRASLDLKESKITQVGLEISSYRLPIHDNGELRRITIISSAFCKENLEKCIIIYMPDGGSTSVLVSNSLVAGLDLERFIFVGVYNSDTDSNSNRIDELLYGYEKDKYDAFMRFMSVALIGFVEKGKIPLARFSAGFSNGGAWALDASLAKESVFNGAIAMSPAQWKFRDDMLSTPMKIYLGAGLMEVRFYGRTKEIATGLRNKNLVTDEVYVPSGHGYNTWVNIWNSAILDINMNFMQLH